ncbi:unnamed protein product [Cuscuta campestris]|uniref:Uncharacterized protein n=1 Tax=Cuscuta campestris TaxID=132261 RepID=A0A484N0A3_9ASTE|nr:unnamed protein product [Cuscuta campestris]
MFKRQGGKTGDSTKDGKARVAKTTMPELRATGDNVDLGLGLGGGLAHRVEWAGITGPMNHGSRQHILHRKTSGVKFNRAIIVTGKLANRNKRAARWCSVHLIRSCDRDHDPERNRHDAGNAAVAARSLPRCWILTARHQRCPAAVDLHCRRITPCRRPPCCCRHPVQPVVVQLRGGPNGFEERSGAVFGIEGTTFVLEDHPGDHARLEEPIVVRKIPEGLTISGNGERTLRGGVELVLKLHRPGRLVVVEDVIDGFPKLGCGVGCRENKITNFIIDRGEDPTLYEGVKLEPFRVIGAGGGRFSGEKITEREPANEKEEEPAPLFVIGLGEA